MEYQRRASLVVLTLLQLCRAEIKDSQQQWFSANIINDKFQPKPIAELFSDEPTFSTATPIIVSSDIGYSGDDGFGSSTPAPPTKMSSFPSTGFTRQTFASSSPTISPLEQQYMTHMTTLTHQTSPEFDVTSVEIPQKSSTPNMERSLYVSELPTQPQRNVQIQESTPIAYTFQPSSAVTETPTMFQSPITETTLSGEILRYELPQTQSTMRPQQQTPRPQHHNLPPNYFLIYQQAPQSFRGLFNPEGVETFPSSPRTTVQESYTTNPPSTFPSTQSSTFSTFSSSFPSTITSTPSTFPSSTPTTRTSPVVSTTATPASQRSSTSRSTPRVTSASTTGSTSRTSRTTFIQDCRNPTTPMPSDILFPLKIRVLSPKGTITNVNINPVQKVQVTTRRPTTTRKPTTRRTPKPKKNTYERCLHGCRKHGETVCAAPLGQDPIHPDELRGFPSVCHMSCHNSYRKIPYEKIIDGSCARLRTRIRPIDSNSKLKKDELHKVQYILDNPGQKAIVEFTGLYT